ncbi:MAG TPA: class I SAM-dependent methyltransferase, partial [Desulfobacteraceae bacterium]|nr:class I SAM-dependent methyltransferase [Desulfobacteraceae bacterium]
MVLDRTLATGKPAGKGGKTFVDFFMNKYIRAFLHKLVLFCKTGRWTDSIWNDSIGQYYTGNKAIYWESIPGVAKYQFELITGDENQDYFSYIIEKLKALNKSGMTGLSIGCCEANSTELAFWETGLFSHFDIMDIADDLLAKQQQKADNEHFSYLRVDLNSVSLPENHYDLITAVGTIHHIKDLDNLFLNINRALKDGGIFFCREYVGPNSLQFSRRQMEIANGMLQCLPASHRITPAGGIKQKARKPNIYKLKIVDPSEAINSENIEKAFKNHLQVIQYTPTGGTLLSPLLNQIAFNFDKDETGRRLLNTMIKLEKELMKCGDIGSDY